MARSTHHPLLFLVLLFSLSAACMFAQATPPPSQVANQVATSVASTLTALPTAVPPTNIPLPTPSPTEVLPPTLIPTIAPVFSPTPVPTAKPAYACDIINQRPRDDSTFEPNQDFDIKWTLVNTGTVRWKPGTYLEYQSGPRMADPMSLELPRLKPGEEYDIVLDAAAPDEFDRQIMVWAVYWEDNYDTIYWMCYPYVRIIVEE